MKHVTATFPTSEAARAVVEALGAAGIPEADITIQDTDNGRTVVSAVVDEGKLDAAAAILKTGASPGIADSHEPARPTVEGHPEGSGPVVMPIVPNR